MTPALRRLLAVERSQLGTAERPSGSNNVKYNTAYYGHKVHNDKHTNYAWCVVFQWWCFQKAGIPTSVFPKSANVFAVRDWYKKKGRFNRTPKVGSLVIFTFSHIGLVVKVNKNGTIQTIEGNTDARGGRTGGCVMHKTRSRDIQGYCHPEYAAVPVHRPAKVSPAAKVTPAVRPAVRPATSPSAARPAGAVSPVHTAVQATGVNVPADRALTVQFTSATANTGKFWAEPVGSKRGYNLMRGPGAVMAEVRVEAPSLPDGSVLECRLVETDPLDHYKVVKVLPLLEISGSDAVARSGTTLASIGPGNHLWLQLSCPEAVVVPAVSAEVVLLPV